MKKLLALMLALIMVFSFAACGEQKQEEGKNDQPAVDPLKGDLSFCIGNPGGTAEIIGGALIELLKQEMPDMNISSVQSAGTAATTMFLAQKEADFGLITAESAYTASIGGEPFGTKADNMRAIASLYPNTLQFWANKDANITCLADIADKRICFGVTSSSQYYPFIEMLKMYDLSPEKIEKNGGSVTTVAWGDAVDMLADGNLDIVIWETSYPAARITSAEAGGKQFDFIQMEPEKMQEWMSKYPGWAITTVPAGTYAGQDKDVDCLGTCMTYYVDKDVPDEVVYHITKCICENLDVLSQTHALMKTVSLDTIGMNLGGEIHPGAEKYYKENNISYSK